MASIPAKARCQITVVLERIYDSEELRNDDLS
jgi:hypothetical protein